jgi:surface antigen
MQIRLTRITIAGTAAVLMALSASAQNPMFLRDSPIAKMDATDRAILRATIESIVLSPDGTETQWYNPETGSRGKLKVMDTHADLGTTCRNVKFLNESKGRRGGGEYRLCLADDGSWKFAPNQSDSDKDSDGAG